ncbi:hypothetical protein [Mesorhizobium sp.]|uniref:hypothetical protein n=1 Tax=Mesorhizobium sp. TaxID=1871066 RepID=UPI000FE99BB2|nr:hypothetical protein [Mesorhizobium sp.]RWM05614.1 MAG: hypothetical protein EOR71_23205 [Mesorhizobium sp.]
MTLGAPREAAGEVGLGKSERSGEIEPPTSDDLKAGEGVTLFRPPVLSHDEWELRQENLAAILRSRRFGEAVQIDVDGDALLGIEAHEFFLDDQLFAEGWSAREPNPIVIHVNRLNAEIHHRAQQIADISGDCVLVPDINAPTDWVVLTPDPMQKAAGNWATAER